MPVLLLMFYYPKEWSNYLLLALCGLALFLTFSRSSWIFSAIAVLYMLIRKRRYSPVIGMAALVLVALVIWPALQEFAASGYSYLSWTNPEGEHAQGLVWFYQRAFLDLGNVLGKGMDDSVQAIPESGYAFLLEHFGFVAYASFLWFCFSLLSYLKQGEGKTSPLALLAQAVAVCIVIVMHTSQYPFAFTEYLFIWFVVGSSICLASKIQPSDESQELAI